MAIHTYRPVLTCDGSATTDVQPDGLKSAFIDRIWTTNPDDLLELAEWCRDAALWLSNEGPFARPADIAS